MRLQGKKQAFAFVSLSCCLVLLAWSSLLAPFDVHQPDASSAWQCPTLGNDIPRVAFLIFPQQQTANEDVDNAEDENNNQQDQQTTAQFIQSARRRLSQTTINPSVNSTNRCNVANVTYFEFLAGDSSPNSDLPRNRDTIRINFQQEKDPKMVLNPCRFLVKYFDPKNCDFVVLVDAGVRLTGFVNVVDTFLAKSGGIFAVVHQAYPNFKKVKTFRSNKSPPMNVSTMSLVHFSSKLIGGPTTLIRDMCEAVSGDEEPASFHRSVNNYLRSRPQFRPKVVILPKGLEKVKVNALVNEATVRRLHGQLQMPPYDHFEVDYGKLLENDAEHLQLGFFQQAAERMADAIRKNYAARVREIFEAALKPYATSKIDEPSKFIVATCTRNLKNATCGGFGDRLRGLAVAFYLAIATGRVFHVEHTKLVDLAAYFDINEATYNLTSAAAYNAQRTLASQRSYVMMRMGAEKDFVDYLNDHQFEQLLRNYDSIELLSNRYTGLASAFGNPKFSRVIANITEYDMASANFDYPIFISAAFRVVLGRISNRLQTLFDLTINTTIGLDLWRNSVKIGIQLRIENLAFFKYDTGGRVNPRQIACFAIELRRLIDDKIRRSTAFGSVPNVVIFVTTDWKEAITLLKQNLSDFDDGRVGGLTFFWTDETQNLTIAHVDQTNEQGDADAAWLSVAKTYLDWFILTKMDFLLISRSGYGETASMMSLKPTKRFLHWERASRCPFQQYNIFMPTVVASGPYPVESL